MPIPLPPILLGYRYYQYHNYMCKVMLKQLVLLNQHVSQARNQQKERTILPSPEFNPQTQIAKNNYHSCTQIVNYLMNLSGLEIRSNSNDKRTQASQM